MRQRSESNPGRRSFGRDLDRWTVGTLDKYLERGGSLGVETWGSWTVDHSQPTNGLTRFYFGPINYLNM